MKTTTLLSVLLIAALAACSQKAPEPAPATAGVVAPVPVPAAPAPAPAPAAPQMAAVSAADLAKGEKVYTATCLACHGAAVMGAPKLGDKAAWGPRIANGVDSLYKNSSDGLKLMPPRGGNASLKDDELKAAVDYMVSKSM